MTIKRYCRITNICSNHNSSIHPKISWASKQGHFHPYGYRSDSQFVIYRTSDYQAPAAYRSVCTSVCTVCEVKTYKDFADKDAFVKYTNRYSVFNERELRNWYKNVDRLLGRKEGEDMDLITYVTDRLGHDARYAIDSTKLQRELGWEPSLQFEEGIEKTVKWYLENQEWLDNVTSGDYQKYYENMYKSRWYN